MIESLIAGERQIDLSSPVCMGIINVTPDSFSDGSELRKLGVDSFQLDIDKALFRAEAMVADGATFSRFIVLEDTGLHIEIALVGYSATFSRGVSTSP